MAGINPITGTPSTSSKNCCSICFSNPQGCVYWRFIDGTCYNYVIPIIFAPTQCVTPMCPKGRPKLVAAGTGDGLGGTFGVGLCAAPHFLGQEPF
jgi:hypothetical protein